MQLSEQIIALLRAVRKTKDVSFLLSFVIFMAFLAFLVVLLVKKAKKKAEKAALKRKAKEAERKAKEEAERKAKEAERKAKEAERKAKEEAERKAWEAKSGRGDKEFVDRLRKAEMESLRESLLIPQGADPQVVVDILKEAFNLSTDSYRKSLIEELLKEVELNSHQ